MTTEETHLKCPVRESSAYLCDRKAEYAINGTVLCHHHAMREVKR